MNDWRVRPIYSATGRVQVYAVEHRQHDTVWREFAALKTHVGAMTLAHHLARNTILVK